MSPAVSGKGGYRIHGGAPGSGAQRGNKNALKHGRYAREAIEERRQMRALLHQVLLLLQATDRVIGLTTGINALPFSAAGDCVTDAL
jgi:hypothetical protein